MSNIIDSIRMSGTTYAISDSGGTKVVEITQSDYDNLPTSAKTANIMYVITDAEPFDVSNYYTKDETSGATELATAFAATQPKLSAGTNITIDANNVISASGGSITIDPSLDKNSSNAVANSAITNNTLSGGVESNNYFRSVRFRKNNGEVAFYKRFAAINGNSVMVDGTTEAPNFQLVETSAITTSVTSSSTDTQIPSAKAVYDALGSGGIDSGTVQTMIDQSISGKTNQTDFVSHSGNTSIHVTTAQTAAWDAKSDFSGSYNDLTDKPTIPSKTSDLTNDSNFATSGYVDSAISGKQDVSGMTAYTTTATTSALNNVVTAHTADTAIHVTTAQTAAWDAKSDFSGSYNDLTDKPTIPIVPTNVSSFNNDAGYITSNDISGKTNQSDFVSHSGNTTMHVTASEKSTWNSKSDFSGNYNDLSNKPTIPTSASQLTNDSGYITSSALNGYATEDYVTAATNDMATKTWVGQQGYLTQHQDISGKQDVSGMTAYTTTATTNTLSGTVTAHTADTTIHVTAQDKTNWNAKSDFSGSYNDLTDKPTLFSGSYNDLTDKPTIPSKTSDLTNDSNFATSAYVDTKLSISDFNTYSGTVNTAIGNKANSSDVYTKSQTSGATEISTALNAKLDTTAYTPTDLSNYYQKSETSGATEIATALSGKQNTLSAGTNITIVDNVISAEGGGKAVSGGTNISITTGETADTINCTLPITAGTGSMSVIMGNSSNIANITAALSLGTITKAQGQGSAAFGERTETTSKAPYSFTCGGYTITRNWHEFAGGKYNVSTSGSTDADKTLFSVGNGTSTSARHNAFEIKVNGDIYITSGGTDILLQDHLGGGGGGNSVVELTQSEYDALVTGGTVDPNTFYVITDAQEIDTDDYYTKSETSGASEISTALATKLNVSDFNTYSGTVNTSLSSKASQNDLDTVSGQVSTNTSNISTVSASTASNTTALGGLSLVKLTQSAYDALSPNYDSNTLYVIVN